MLPYQQEMTLEFLRNQEFCGEPLVSMTTNNKPWELAFVIAVKHM